MQLNGPWICLPHPGGKSKPAYPVAPVSWGNGSENSRFLFHICFLNFPTSWVLCIAYLACFSVLYTCQCLDGSHLSDVRLSYPGAWSLILGPCALSPWINFLGVATYGSWPWKLVLMPYYIWLGWLVVLLWYFVVMSFSLLWLCLEPFSASDAPILIHGFISPRLVVFASPSCSPCTDISKGPKGPYRELVIRTLQRFLR